MTVSVMCAKLVIKVKGNTCKEKKKKKNEDIHFFSSEKWEKNRNIDRLSERDKDNNKKNTSKKVTNKNKGEKELWKKQKKLILSLCAE